MRVVIDVVYHLFIRTAFTCLLCFDYLKKAEIKSHTKISSTCKNYKQLINSESNGQSYFKF